MPWPGKHAWDALRAYARTRFKKPWAGGTGEPGEHAAARLLERRGYRIVGRNLRLGRNELDIVAWDGDTLVFVEVRSRHAGPDEEVYPEDSIGASKRRHLSAAARYYLRKHRIHDVYWRFDVVAVVFRKGGKPETRLIQDAFAAD